jgi:ABC-type multidrug transport system fused ATPase/permease subunit
MLKKIALLLEPKELLLVSFIFIISLVSNVLEIIGITLIPSLVLLIFNKNRLAELLEQYNLFSNFFDSRIVLSDNFLSLFLIFVCTVFLLKNIYLGIALYLQNFFYSKIYINIVKKLTKFYSHCSYEFHIKRNSNELIRNIISETNTFRAFISNVIIIVKEIIFFIFIFLILLTAEVKSTLIIFSSILLFSLLYFSIVKKKVLNKSKINQLYRFLILKKINSFFSMIKIIKLDHKEDYFINSFINYIVKEEKNIIFQRIISNYPKLIFELLFVFGISFFFLFLSKKALDDGINIFYFFPLITLYVFSFLRLVPSFNSLLSNLTDAKANYVSVETLYKEFFFLKDTSFRSSYNKIKFSKSISLVNVSFFYKSSKKKVLNNVSIKILKGQTIGIYGKSGAGKSTLVDIIAGILKPNFGKVLSDGKNIQKYLYNWQSKIAYVPQEVYILDDSIEKNIAYGLDEDKINYEYLNKAIDTSQLSDLYKDLKSRNDNMLGNKGIKISGGQRQRIGIARAIYKNPDILILDESTSSLDKHTEKEFFNCIKKLKITKIIITHKINLLKFCDKIFILDNGFIKNK